jgi:methylated-DNA-[protein]-cysteine S-methyltransferase
MIPRGTDPRAPVDGDVPIAICQSPYRAGTARSTLLATDQILNTENSPRISPFASRVYAALKRVPRGRVITYAALAAKIGCGSPRAVGQALRANPFAPEVPCHRVIASDLSPGGFVGQTAGPQLRRKLRLLASEGVLFRNGFLAEPRRAIR